MIHFLDIGANTGQAFDCYLSKNREYDGCRVWCFEPSPRHWPALTAKANEYASRYRVELCPFGVAGHAGDNLFIQSQSGEGDSCYPELRTHNGTPMQDVTTQYGLWVATLRLSDIIMAHTKKGDAVTVKLDCEGSEYAALAELLWCPDALARVTKIMVEFHVMDSIDWRTQADRLIEKYANVGKTVEPWIL